MDRAEMRDIAHVELAKAGLTPEQITGGALDATMQLAEATDLSADRAAHITARALLGFQLTSAPVPRIQVMALPPERAGDLEHGQFVLVFDRIPTEMLHDNIVAAVEGLKAGLGARGVLVFTEEVEVIPGFEIDPALADRIRAALDNGEKN